MDLFSDNFISYNDDFNVKLEKSSDHDISLDSPSLQTCESTPNLYPLSLSSNLQNLLNSHDSLYLTRHAKSQIVPKKHKPFMISKALYFQDRLTF